MQKGNEHQTKNESTSAEKEPISMHFHQKLRHSYLQIENYKVIWIILLTESRYRIML